MPASTMLNQTEDFWLANLAIIQQRWPDLATALATDDSFCSAWNLVDHPAPTLIIDGLQLTSRYDRRREALLQASLVPDKAKRAWVYGPALGDLPRLLLERPDLNQLTVVILNPAVTKLSLTCFDQGDWLKDPRVQLVAATEDTPLQRPFAASPACLLLAAESAGPLRDRVFLELATPYIRQKHRGSPRIQKRLEKNTPFVAEDRDAAELFGTQAGNTLVVAAAGPSLSDHYSWLSKAERPPLIAVDAALKPLLQAGITPDFVVSIDAYPDLYQIFFQDVIAEVPNHIPLIYFPVVASEVLARWPGPRFACYPGTLPYRPLAKRFPKAELFSSGSVLHPAVDLAARMQASKIILAGADLSYPGNQSHVAGCGQQGPPAGTGRHWVLNGHGERVATTPNMRGYLRDLEDYIARQEGIVFINAGKKGAAIRNTCYLEEGA